jgi:hypothetical protein
MIVAALTVAGLLPGQDSPVRKEVAGYVSYKQVVEKTMGMVNDAEAKRLAKLHGLDILNLTWEDAGRWKNSALGPNISDMTIQVQLMDPRNERFSLHCMPVIRYPNFSDLSCDVPPDRFFVLVGNEKGAERRKVSLTELLGDLRRYLTKPESWKGDRRSLLADRDAHVLVSAQACFLPIPKEGSAEFNPVLFNYQSFAGHPAVLAVLATREGTSVTVIDNERDAYHAGRTWGQRLFFNQRGERASLTGKRKSEYVPTPRTGEPQVERPAANDPSLNLVLLVQVPLKQAPQRRRLYSGEKDEMMMKAAPGALGGGGRRSDVEDAVIGHGRVEGPFTEIANLPIERDPKFPIRVTVQFYKATSNGVVSADDLESIAAQIRRVYKDADYVGSLVTEGYTGRPTEFAPIPRR